MYSCFNVRFCVFLRVIMVKVISTYIQRILDSYGYESITEFLLSLCPSFKYHIQVPTLTISSVIALIAHILGVGPLIVAAMLIAVCVETSTGIWASHIKKITFESFKFSRCVLKVFIWMSLIFMVNAFYLECSDSEEWYNQLGSFFFAVVKLFVLAYFVIEYLVSIMENLAVIDGKPKTEFIDGVKSLLASLMQVLKSKFTNK